MGIATGLTAERMLELANGFLVSGHVDANGNLILANGGGVTQNAGSVKGPKGDTGVKGDTGLKGDVGPKGADAAVLLTPMSVTDAPSAYPTGISTFSISDATTNGVWPTWPGTVETIRHGVNRSIQIFAEKVTGKTWIRTEDANNGWGSWNQSSYVGHTHSGTDITSGLLPSARLEDIVPRGRGSIGTPVDWNTLTVAGTYGVDALGANAPAATPAVSTGVLVVDVSVVNDKIAQTFYNHDGNWGMWVRTKQSSGGAWNAWVEIHNWGDIKRDLPAFFSDSGSTNWLPARLQPTAQDISNLNIQNIKTTGFYKGQTVTNAPGTSWYYYEIIRHDDSYINYVAYDYFSDKVWRAYYQSGNWKTWQQLNDSDTGWVTLSPTFLNGCTYVADVGNWAGMKARRIGNETQMILANVNIPANTFASVPADGNVANTDILSNIPAQFRPGAGTMGLLQATAAGPMASFYLDDSGKLTVGAVAPGTTATGGHTYGIAGNYYN